MVVTGVEVNRRWQRIRELCKIKGGWTLTIRHLIQSYPSRFFQLLSLE